MLFVIGELAVGDLQVLCLGNRFRQFRAVRRIGRLQGIEEDQAGVVPFHGEDIGNLVEFRFVRLDELLDAGILVFRRVGVGEEAVVGRGLAGDFRQFRGIPAVGTQQRYVQADFTGLFDNLGDFFVVPRNVDRVRIGRLNLRQGRLKVDILGQERFVRRNRAAGGREFSVKTLLRPLE